MFSCKIDVNFFHADPAGVIFFANIFNLAHTAYENMISEAQLERSYFYDNDFAIPIIHAEVDFKKPIFPGSKIRVNIIVTKLKDSSFELKYLFYDDDEELTAQVKTVHVMISKDSWQKTNIPPDLFEFLLTHKEEL